MSNADINIGSNSDVNKKKSPVTSPDAPKVVIPTAQHDNLKMLTEKHKDENLAMTLFDYAGWLDCFSFLIENQWHHYYSQLVVPW